MNNIWRHTCSLIQTMAICLAKKETTPDCNEFLCTTTKKLKSFIKPEITGLVALRTRGQDFQGLHLIFNQPHFRSGNLDSQNVRRYITLPKYYCPTIAFVKVSP